MKKGAGRWEDGAAGGGGIPEILNGDVQTMIPEQTDG